MARDGCNIYFFYFGPSYPPNSPKNQNLKKTLGDIIILHMCTKNYGQMMYGATEKVTCGCPPKIVIFQ